MKRIYFFYLTFIIKKPKTFLVKIIKTYFNFLADFKIAKNLFFLNFFML